MRMTQSYPKFKTFIALFFPCSSLPFLLSAPICSLFLTIKRTLCQLRSKNRRHQKEGSTFAVPAADFFSCVLSVYVLSVSVCCLCAFCVLFCIHSVLSFCSFLRAFCVLPVCFCVLSVLFCALSLCFLCAFCVL